MKTEAFASGNSLRSVVRNRDRGLIAMTGMIRELINSKYK